MDSQGQPITRVEPRVESMTDEGTPPTPSVSANISESSNVPVISSVPECANISPPEDRNVSESASAPVPSAPEEHISIASWAEICDNSPSVHRLPQVANPRLPRITSLGCCKPTPVVSTAPQRKPTRPSLGGAKKPDDLEDMDTRPSS